MAPMPEFRYGKAMTLAVHTGSWSMMAHGGPRRQRICSPAYRKSGHRRPRKSHERLDESHFHIRPFVEMDALNESHFARAQCHNHGRGSYPFSEKPDAL